MRSAAGLSRRALVGVVMVISLFAGAGGMALAVDFPDTGSSPFENEIDHITDAGCASGFPDGTFRPAENVKRQQFAFWINNCAPRMAALSSADLSGGLSNTLQTFISSFNLDMGGAPGRQQYVVIDGWFNLSSTDDCPCIIQSQVFVDGPGAADTTTMARRSFIEVASGGTVEVGPHRVLLNTDTNYTLHPQARVLSNLGGPCTSNCLFLEEAEIMATTAPFGAGGGVP
jgi:hypothetical protein